MHNKQGGPQSIAVPGTAKPLKGPGYVYRYLVEPELSIHALLNQLLIMNIIGSIFIIILVKLQKPFWYANHLYFEYPGRMLLI